MTIEQGYKFNGIDLGALGLIVTKCSPAPCSQEEYDTISVPGRSDQLRIPKKTRKSVQIVAECTLVEPDRLRDVYAVMQGKGTFVHRDEPDKYYRAVPQVITPQNIILYMNKMTITFDCEPFAYEIEDPDVEISDTTSFSVTNYGTVYCQPTYTLYGTGEIALTANGDTVHTLVIPGVEDYVVADAEKIIVHKDGTFKRFSGQIPFLNVGKNTFESNAEKIVIKKNVRWI